jgi:hypothetical protein
MGPETTPPRKAAPGRRYVEWGVEPASLRALCSEASLSQLQVLVVPGQPPGRLPRRMAGQVLTGPVQAVLFRTPSPNEGYFGCGR